MDEAERQMVDPFGAGWLRDMAELLVFIHEHVGYPIHLTIPVVFYKSISLCMDAFDEAEMGI